MPQLKPFEDNVMSLPSVGPYLGVSCDEIKTLKDKRKFRLIIYGAYNALGLIGSECNGIAVLDEDNKEVVCDEMSKADTGYFGPTKEQLKLYDYLMKASDTNFKNIINTHPRARYKI